MDSAEGRSTPSATASLAQAILEIAGQEGRQDLLQLIRPSGGGVLPPVSDGGSFDSVASLVLLANRQKVALDDGYDGTAAQSLVRLVEHKLFVDEVRRVVDRARPGYRERVEELTSPRGRLSGTSLVLALLTGTPQVRCRFDEQSGDTTLLRIVLAGLHTVARERVPPALSHLSAPIRAQAVGLARKLDTVAVLDRERALVAARRLVLNSLEQQWAGAVLGAVQVLSRASVVPTEGNARTDRALAVHLYMEKWWEQCLLGALHTIADPNGTHAQVPVSPPWLPFSGPLEGANRRADFIFELEGKHVLADAKYKVDTGSLGASDGDQMFAYSHTAKAPGSSQLTDSGAVFYPNRSGQVGQNGRNLLRAPERTYELRLVDLPFPERTDVRTDEAWTRYQKALGRAIRTGLTLERQAGQTAP